MVISEIQNDNFDLGTLVITTQYLLSKNERKISEEYLSNFVNNKNEMIFENYIESKAELKIDGIPDEYAIVEGYGFDIALVENFII